MTVANIILEQMGGIRNIKMMTSAKDFLDHGEAVSFKFQGSRKVNYVKVTLNTMDTYNLEFGKIGTEKSQFGGRMPSYKVIENIDDIYNDNLKSCFENYTGLYLSLF